MKGMKAKWMSDVLPQKLCTVSNDGKILHWLFALNDLFLHDMVVTLDANDWSGENPPKGVETDTESESQDVPPEEMDVKMAGLSISINSCEEDLFVVGTEPGVIYTCSFDDKKSLDYYEDHKHSVRNVHWNPYHPRVFLSCSEDMTIRIWDHSLRDSVFEFFFENEVKDACWAPFSSTLFAAVSGNAIVYVFDLFVNKKEAIGTYTIYSDKENVTLTTICFHPCKPILMVGDEKGIVSSFKLSPNLRSSLSAMESLEESKFVEAEVAKMEKLLAPAKGRQKRMQ